MAAQDVSSNIRIPDRAAVLPCIYAGFFGGTAVTPIVFAKASLLPIAGYVGITCGVAAWYVAFAHVTNATFGRELIPTWPLT